MNILIISKNYYPSTIPDSKRFTGISEYFVKQGHNVYIITETNDAVTEYSKLKIIKTSKKREDSKGMIDRFFNHFSFMFQSMRKGKKLFEIDVIIATSPPLFNLVTGAYLKRKLDAKFVVDLRDIWPDVFVQTGVMTKKNPVYLFFDIVAKYCYKKADSIVVVTKGKKKLIDMKFPEYTDKVSYLSNGFNLNITEYTDIVEIKNIFDGFFNVIYTGKIGMAQDIKSFVDLANHYRTNNKIKFHIMGSGKDKDIMLSYIESKKLDNIIYHGYLSEHEVITALNCSQISYVSLANKELIDSVPTKIYESLVCGCPILLSAVGDSVDLVLHSKFGRASDPGDFEKLCSNFQFMYDNHYEYMKRKKQVRDRMISEYSRDVIAEMYQELINVL
uniref:Glycosyltransferase family 4 protein n=1 Tax=Erysipelothrix rhusiopathiae TaxID=1648 RepID=A0A6S6I2A7_ERYRH|nr:glycosyltransferase family 4 protein [Erysipelothrix rhusiopathiae]